MTKPISALDAFAQALFDAPWWGEAYRQIARAQEMVGRRADAAASLELYLVANPQEPNWEDVRTRIRALRGLKPQWLCSVTAPWRASTAASPWRCACRPDRSRDGRRAGSRC